MTDQQRKEFELEWHNMITGEPYNAFHSEFQRRLYETRERIRRYNDTLPNEVETLDGMLRNILGSIGRNPVINQPFRCDFGCNIHIGDNFIGNFNLTILDEAKVVIGDNVFIGPNVGLYTPCHPLEPTERNKGIEWAKPITIGSNVWIGGGTTVLPGVTIGEGSTIGAGSVVVRDIPSRCVAVGNPCKVMKYL